MNRELAKLTDEIDAIVKRGNYVRLDPHEAGAIVTALRRLAASDHGVADTPLTCDFAQALPGGKLDDSTYGNIEDALDKIEAPAKDANGKWLSLHERIAAIPMSDHGGADAGGWPAGCQAPASCKRLGVCMYIGCKYHSFNPRPLSKPAVAANASAEARDFCTYGTPNERKRQWIIIFEDADRGMMIFSDEREAHTAWDKAKDNWTCTLFETSERKYHWAAGELRPLNASAEVRAGVNLALHLMKEWQRVDGKSLADQLIASINRPSETRWYSTKLMLKIHGVLKALSAHTHASDCDKQGSDCGATRCRDLGCFGACKPSDRTADVTVDELADFLRNKTLYTTEYEDDARALLDAFTVGRR